MKWSDHNYYKFGRLFLSGNFEFGRCGTILPSFRENMNFDKINDLFRYQFWHLFVMSLGIDVGTPLASNSMFWDDRFWE